MVINKRKQYLHFFFFIFPAFFVCTLFIIIPFIRGVWSAFTDADLNKNTSVHYIGLQNFAEIFDPVKEQRFLPKFNTHYLFKDNYELPFSIDSGLYKGMLLKRIKNTEDLVLLEKAYPVQKNGNYILDQEYIEFALYDRLMILTSNDHTLYSEILYKIRDAAFSENPPEPTLFSENLVSTLLNTLQKEPDDANLSIIVDNELPKLLEQYYNVFMVKKILTSYLYKKDFILGAVGFTVLYTLLNLLIASPIALLLAIALNRRFLIARILRTFLFLPYVLSAITISFLCFFIFETVPPFITGAGNWLENPEIAPMLIVFAGVWRNCGFLVLIYLAGLQAIPREYQEAAALDGANNLQIFLKITGPLLLPFLSLGIIWNLASSLKVFDLVFGLTRTTAYTTNTASWLLDIYINIYTGNRFGYAMAKVLLLSLLCAVITSAHYIAMKKQEAASC